MPTHDASDRAYRALLRDPRATATAAAVPARVRRRVGRRGGNVPHVGFRAAGDARSVVSQGSGTAAREDPARLWSLEALAAELGVHVRTLRNAARSGRLCVTFESRVVFGHLVPRATLAAGRTFIERYYKRCYSRTAPPPTPPPAHPGACRLATTAAADPGRPCPHPNPAGPADRGGGESRHLSVGSAQATAVPRVLDED